MRTAASILTELGIAYRRGLAVWTATCPQCSAARAKRRAQCLSVRVDEAGVLWHCFHCSWSGRRYFDGDHRDDADSRRVEHVERHADGDATRIRRARAIWAEATSPVGTLVEKYLVGRGLRLPAELAERVVRFHAACPWRDDESGKLVHVPAMIAAMRSITTDEPQAMQITALRADGTKVARKMRGVAGGAAIKLDRDEFVTTSLGIAEGFENALVPYLVGWHPVWALGSAGAIEEFPALPGIESLTIFADNDARGRGAALLCAERWRAAGMEVLVRLSAAKDWNAAIGGGAS